MKNLKIISTKIAKTLLALMSLIVIAILILLGTYLPNEWQFFLVIRSYALVLMEHNSCELWIVRVLTNKFIKMEELKKVITLLEKIKEHQLNYVLLVRSTKPYKLADEALNIALSITTVGLVAVRNSYQILPITIGILMKMKIIISLKIILTIT